MMQLQLSLTRCLEHPAVSAVILDRLASNVRAHRFYERLGSKSVKYRQFGEDACFVYCLERGVYEQHWLG